MDDEKDPFVDGIGDMVVRGERQALTQIADQLKFSEHLSFADSKIYKVTYPRDAVEQANQGALRLLQFIAVEVTVGVFKDEAVRTFFIRDCTEYVRAMKSELKEDKKRMKKEYEDKIIEVVADLSKLPGKQIPTNAQEIKDMLAAEEQKIAHGPAAKNRHPDIDAAHRAVDKVLKGKSA